MYMSYEQLSNVPDIDARSDVYAFGVILYEAMTGRRPYEADNFPQLVLRIVQSEPVPPRQLQPALPKALESVIVRAMAKDRTQRIPSLTVLARELEPFASEAMFQAQHSLSQPTLPHALPAALDTTLSRASSVAQPSAAASRTRLRALLALAAALVTGAVIATRYLRDTEGPTDPPQPSAAGGVPDEPAGRALIPAANVPAKQTRSPDLPSQLSTQPYRACRIRQRPPNAPIRAPLSKAQRRAGVSCQPRRNQWRAHP
jgi:serine/threonine-protein kinase